MEHSLFYIYWSVAVFGLFLVLARGIEGTWFPPSLLFVAGFFSHAFVYIYTIIVDENTYPVFAYYNFDTLLFYSLAAFVALVAGYMVGGILSFHRGKAIKTRPHMVMSFQAAEILVRVALFLMAFNYYYTYVSGALDVAKGVGAYSVSDQIPLLSRLGFIAFYTAGPLLFLLYVGSYSFGSQRGTSIRRLVFFAVGLSLVLSLLMMERKSTVSLLLFILIFYHYRVRAIRILHISIAISAIVLLQAFTHLRALGTGILEISPVEILSLLISTIIDRPGLIFVQIATAIPGQDVFSNVLNIVPATEGFKYGSTYLNSILGLLTPRSLGLGSYNDETLAMWYMNAYAPGTTNNGFDFSMLAEAYLNFGVWMPVLFFLIGVLLAKISLVITSSSSYLMVFAAIVVLVALTLSLRSDSNTLLKSCVYFVLPPIILMRAVDLFLELIKEGRRAYKESVKSTN
jgi:hypothetical protein